MRKLLHVGDRVIDLSAVVAAEKGEGSLTVYLAGVIQPFRFTSGEAGIVWSALLDQVDPVATASSDDPSDFQVIEMPLGDDGADEEQAAVAGPMYKSIELGEHRPDSQMIA